MKAIREERREIVLLWLPRVVRVTPRDETYVYDAVFQLPSRERYALVERVTLQLQDLPDTRLRTHGYLRLAWRERPKFHTPISADEDAAECRIMLGRLAQSKNPEVRAAAQEFRRQLDDLLKRPAPSAPPPKPEGVRFQPLQLVLQSSGRGVVGRIDGVRSIGPGVDVVWGGDTIYLMKEKGKLRPVWTTNKWLFGFRTVCFDGRYVWATSWQADRWPIALVLDPVSEKVWEISGDDGLPQGSADQLKGGTHHYLDVAPLEPGRACVAGSFGRTWVATVAFDAVSGKAAVKVIHEAREAQTGKDVNEGLRTTVDFNPRCMFTVKGWLKPGGKTERRVALFRDGMGADSERHQLKSRPLVIDPDAPAVAVLPSRQQGNVPFFPGAYSATDHAVYTIERSPERQPTCKAYLLRIGMPDLDAKRVAAAGAESPGASAPSVEAVCIHGDRLHYIWSWREGLPQTPTLSDASIRQHHEWWTVELDGTASRRMGVNVPKIHALGTSSHYGMVAIIFKAGSSFVPHRVEFVDPPKKE